jgi:iron-sulfur cluster assembly accessory protein
MIHIRPNAQKELHRLLNKQSKRLLIHLSVVNGGCSDWTYQLTLVETYHHQEATAYSVDDLTIVLPNLAIPYLQNLTIDYVEDLMGGGFRFINPQAQTTCGCGNSFSINAESEVTSPSGDCMQVDSATLAQKD